MGTEKKENPDFGEVVLREERRGLRVTEIRLNPDIRRSLSTTAKRLEKACGIDGH